MGLFQPKRRKAETLLLAWLSASLRHVRFGSVADILSDDQICPLSAISRLPDAPSLLLHHLMVDQLERVG